MAAPTELANQTKIIDGLEWLLRNRLNNAGGFRTDGAVIIRGMDPRYYQTNYAKEYSQKNCCVSIKVGDAVLNSKKSLGGTKHWTQIIQLWCLATLTKDQQTAKSPTIDVLESNLRTDLTFLLDSDSDLKDTAIALDAITPAAGYQNISCTDLKVVNFTAGSIANWPNTNFIAHCTVEFNQFRARF